MPRMTIGAIKNAMLGLANLAGRLHEPAKRIDARQHRRCE